MQENDEFKCREYLRAIDEPKDVTDQSKHSAANNLHKRKTFDEKQAAPQRSQHS